MKILIAGLGSIGRRHLRNLQNLGVEDIILYRTHRSTLPDDEVSQLQVESDLDSALDHSPDAVIVSNPTSLHLQVAVPAAKNGCHLLIEKPVSHSMEGVEELTSIVENEQNKVLVGYQFRFHPGLQKVKDLLQSETIGRPISARAHWGEYLPDWHPWEDYRRSYSARSKLGGGVILTLSHPLDYLHWLFGEVEEVIASSGKLGNLELDVEDTAEIILKFASGLTASVHLDYLRQPPNHSLEVIGTDGTIEWNYYDGDVKWYQSIDDEWLTWSSGAEFDRNEMFKAQMDHFLALIRGEQESLCSLDDGVRALQTALAALESSKLKKSIRLK